MKQNGQLGIWRVIALAVVTIGLNGQTQSSLDKTRTLEAVVGELLRNSNSPRGLEVITGCTNVLSDTSTRRRGKLKSLDSIARSQKALTWSKGVGNSYRAVIRYSSDASLSSSHVLGLHIESKTVTVASSLLVDDPVVRAEIANLGFAELTGHVGFSPIRVYNHLIDLPAGTLGDDLTLLASSFGGVWQLDQHVCGTTRTFRIEKIRS